VKAHVHACGQLLPQEGVLFVKSGRPVGVNILLGDWSGEFFWFHISAIDCHIKIPWALQSEAKNGHNLCNSSRLK
jgi:hypothetical protein